MSLYFPLDYSTMALLHSTLLYITLLWLYYHLTLHYSTMALLHTTSLYITLLWLYFTPLDSTLLYFTPSTWFYITLPWLYFTLQSTWLYISLPWLYMTLQYSTMALLDSIYITLPWLYFSLLDCTLLYMFSLVPVCKCWLSCLSCFLVGLFVACFYVVCMLHSSIHVCHIQLINIAEILATLWYWSHLHGMNLILLGYSNKCSLCACSPHLPPVTPAQLMRTLVIPEHVLHSGWLCTCNI